MFSIVVAQVLDSYMKVAEIFCIELWAHASVQGCTYTYSSTSVAICNAFYTLKCNSGLAGISRRLYIGSWGLGFRFKAVGLPFWLEGLRLCALRI